jgi:small subunit ribosomal protein S20
MPQRASAKKDLRKNKKKRKINYDIKENLKVAIKKFKKTLENKDTAKIQQALKDTYKIIDKTAAKGLIHQNRAAREKSRITKLLNKPATAKPSSKRAATKK